MQAVYNSLVKKGNNLQNIRNTCSNVKNSFSKKLYLKNFAINKIFEWQALQKQLANIA